MKFIITIFFLLFSQIIRAQTWGDSTALTGLIFNSVDKPPKFPGGMKGFYIFISENLEVPQNDSFRFSNRYVIADIVINQEGKVVYGKITKGLNTNYNNAVLQMFSKMPLWEPGMQNGKSVKCYQTIPIVFINSQ